MTHSDKQLQRETQSLILDGTQSRLAFNPISEKEHKRQMKNANARKVTAYKNCRENFYVLDTETNGFDYNEPVQIAAVRFENGEQKDSYREYFMPKEPFSKSAKDTTGLSKKKLK